MTTEEIRSIPKVHQLTTPGGNMANHQYVIITGDRAIFQSYGTTIAIKDKITGELFLDIDHDISMTTIQYRNIFLRDYCNEPPGEIEHRIETEAYTIEPLNL